jgi:putative DNA primase/helicase
MESSSDERSETDNAVLGQITPDRLRQAEGGVVIISTTKERAYGQWQSILSALGMGSKFLTDKQCPCPLCGGTDRFQFIGKLSGDGMWRCRHCQPEPRPAIDLAVKFVGKSFKEVATMIDVIVGGRVAKPVTEPVKNNSAYPNKVWKRGVVVRPGDVVDRYLRHRGVGRDIYPSCLRASAMDWYRDDDTGFVEQWPAMFALVRNAAGKAVAVHRTFLAMDGMGKAAVKVPRKMAGPMGKSPTIRLAPAASTMGIAEGIETALSASLLFKIPVWSVVCTHGIETFEPPSECEQLVIFADNDAHGRGEQAAETLAARLQMRVHIRLPHLKDWNDVLLEQVKR